MHAYLENKHFPNIYIYIFYIICIIFRCTAATESSFVFQPHIQVQAFGHFVQANVGSYNHDDYDKLFKMAEKGEHV